MPPTPAQPTDLTRSPRAKLGHLQPPASDHAAATSLRYAYPKTRARIQSDTAGMKFFHPLLTFIFHLNYLGPLVMGTLDSSFLVLPFGNDLVVVGLVAGHRHNVWLYVLTAALGSTLGAFLLASVANKLGEARIHKIMGDRQFQRLRRWLDGHGALSIAAGALAPPPFPYTVVIAAAATVGYPIRRLLLVNFVARAVRFSLLAWLALTFGKQVLAISQSRPFLWTMSAFVVGCLGATVFSLWKWFGTRRNVSPA